MTREEAIQKYGPIDLDIGHWENEAQHMQLMLIPKEIKTWINRQTGRPIYHLYVNKDFAPPLLLALNEIVEIGLIGELKWFDGTYAIRDIRGMPGELSEHSYGCAIDINARENPLYGESSFSPAFVKCFLDAGLKWGGTFPRKDPMHFCLNGW